MSESNKVEIKRYICLRAMAENADGNLVEYKDYECLKRENSELRKALSEYSNRQNWGYYDDSGCSKGYGQYTDACFVGPEVAELALQATNKA